MKNFLIVLKEFTHVRYLLKVWLKREQKKTIGGIDVDDVIRLVDQDTCLLSVMSASNISGNIMDIEVIVKKAREIKPDLYIISDAVQHAPHHSIDVEKLQIDGMNFAPCFP